MRNKLLYFCMLLAALAILMLASVVASFDRPYRDIIGYNVLKERMFEGVVATRGDVTEGLLYFALKMANGTVEVQIGPREFVDRCGFKLNTGDRVTVIGMPVVINKRQVVLAREVRGVHGALTVRDEVGRPLWEKPIQMDPERRVRHHEEC